MLVALGTSSVRRFDPLGHQIAGEHGDAGDVAARSVEAGDEARLHRIAGGHHNDGNCGGPGFGCGGWNVAERSNHPNAQADKIGHQHRQPIMLIVRPAILDCDVLALDETSLVQALAERSNKGAEPACRREGTRPPASPAAARAPPAATSPPRRRAA